MRFFRFTVECGKNFFLCASAKISLMAEPFEGMAICHPSGPVAWSTLGPIAAHHQGYVNIRVIICEICVQCSHLWVSAVALD